MKVAPASRRLSRGHLALEMRSVHHWLDLKEMNQFKGQALSWELKDGVIELALHRDPCNEIGSLTLEELENLCPRSSACKAMPTP